MIDTLNLELDFLNTKIEKSLSFIIEKNYDSGTNNVINDHKLWVNEKEENKFGKRAYLNVADNKMFRFEIKHWKDGKNHFILKTSIPKILFGDNYYEINNRDELIEALKKLTFELSRYGIKTDLSRSKVIRIDLFKNLRMAYSYHYYKEIFLLLNIFNCCTRIYQSSYYWIQNRKLWSIIFYDKYKEIMDKNNFNDNCFPNTIRAEIKFLKYRAIENYLNISTVNDLIENFSKLKTFYNDFIREKIFYYDVKLKNNRKINSSILDQYVLSNNELKEYELLKNIGIHTLLSNYGKEKAIEEIIRLSSLKGSSLRSKKSRLSKLVSQVELDYNLQQESKDKSFMLDELYFELKNKLLDKL